MAPKYGANGAETKQLSEVVTLELEKHPCLEQKNGVWGIPWVPRELKKGSCTSNFHIMTPQAAAGFKPVLQKTCKLPICAEGPSSLYNKTKKSYSSVAVHPVRHSIVKCNTLINT